MLVPTGGSMPPLRRILDTPETTNRLQIDSTVCTRKLQDQQSVWGENQKLSMQQK